MLTILLVCACASEPASPEQEVRSVLEKAEAAAEARDLDVLRDLIADDYRDERNRGKAQVLGAIQFYFATHRSIHLLTQVKQLTFTEPDRAEVGLLVGMAGRRAEGTTDWSLFRADLYRFDFSLRYEGADDWKVVEAAWRRASLEEVQ